MLKYFEGLNPWNISVTRNAMNHKLHSIQTCRNHILLLQKQESSRKLCKIQGSFEDDKNLLLALSTSQTKYFVCRCGRGYCKTSSALYLQPDIWSASSSSAGCTTYLTKNTECKDRITTCDKDRR
jgi:hypothetical protein